MHFRPVGALVGALAIAAPVSADADADAFATAFLPTAVRRMPTDPGAKFYPAEYQAFAPEITTTVMPLAPREAAAAVILDRIPGGVHANASATSPVRQPVFRAHQDTRGDMLPWQRLRRAAEALHVLQGRSSCPSGFASCKNIGYENKCCAKSETCVKVENEDTGNVACCPSGSTCSGNVASCPASAVSCPSSLGGGCCLSGYACEGSGCIMTVTVTATTSTSSTAATTTSTTTTTDTSAVAPYRPTTTTGATTTTSTTTTHSSTHATDTTTTATLDSCPTGYYACLARYGGGCCQTGRDCQETSCVTASTTIISRSDLTIAIPASDSPTTTVEASGSCATGWFLCAATPNVVNGCCPDNYACGSESCTLATAGATTAVRKESTTSGAGRYAVSLGAVAMAVAAVALS